MRVGIEQREVFTSLQAWHDVIVTVEWSDAALAAVKRHNLRGAMLVERPLAQSPNGAITDTSLKLSTLLDRAVTRVRCIQPEQAFDFEDELKRALRNLPGIQVRFDATLCDAYEPRGSALAERWRRITQVLWPLRLEPSR